jgi:hypothetical protein
MVATPIIVISVAAGMSFAFWVISFAFDRAERRRDAKRHRNPSKPRNS